MAQKTTVTLIDDLDGSEAEETLGFGLDGVTYEIDLSADNARTLRNALGDYVEHARRQGRTSARRGRRTGNGSAPSPASTGSSAADREQNRAIRDWARQHGYTVSERGRIPSEVSEAYHRSR